MGEGCQKMGEKRDYRMHLVLPERGVIGADGNPFYHHCLAKLKEKHYKRIEESGIYLVRGHFTATEDRRIRKNWRRFAREHNLKHEDVWKFLPARYHRSALGVSRRGSSMMRMIYEEDFWCKMCRKLDGRLANQVVLRMCCIFNPFYISGETFRPWTTADDDELIDLLRMYGRDYALIAFKVHRLIPIVKARYEHLMDNKAPSRIPHGDLLLDCVCLVAGISSIFNGIAQNFDFSTLNWDKVAKLLDSNEDVTKLQERFFREKLPASVDLFERFNGSCKKAMQSLTKRDQLSPQEEGLAVIPLLIEQNARSALDLDREKFKQRLVESGYVRNNVEAAEKCPVILHRISRQFRDKFTASQLHIPLTYDEKLRVLLEVYKDPTYTPRKIRRLVLEKAASLFQGSNGKNV